MNTKRIQSTYTLYFPSMPILTSNKCTKVVTKHFCNIALYMSANQASMLWWLLYQSGADGTFNYSTNLLRKYSKSLIEARKLYGSKNKLTSSLMPIRNNFEWLIKNGYLFWMEDKVIINPMLSYYERLSRKDYLSIADKYQRICKENLQPFLLDYVKLVKSKMK